MRTGWAAGCMLASLTMVSEAAAPPLTGVLACRDIANAADRLACFDRETAVLAGAPAVPATPATAAVPATPAATAVAAPSPAAPAIAPAAAPPAAPAIPAAQTAPASSPLDAEQQFGLPERSVAAKEVAAGTRAADVAKVEARIASLAAAADGRILFTLDNGQVWRQLQAEGDLLAKPGDIVVVSRAMLGSFWLSVPSGRGCKVTRLR